MYTSRGRRWQGRKVILFISDSSLVTQKRKRKPKIKVPSQVASSALYKGKTWVEILHLYHAYKDILLGSLQKSKGLVI